MTKDQSISDGKTRLVLLLILTVLLHEYDYGIIAWFATSWSGAAFIALIVNVHNQLYAKAK